MESTRSSSMVFPSFQMQSTPRLSFKEDGLPIRIVDDSLQVRLALPQQRVDYVVAKIINIMNSNQESLEVTTALKKYNVSINNRLVEVQLPYPTAKFQNGSLRIEGVSTTKEWEAVLKTLKYANAADEPNLQRRVVQLFAFSKGKPGTPLNIHISMLASNDAPYFNGRLPLTKTILEDSNANQLVPMNVEELFGSLISDRDSGSEKVVPMIRQTLNG
jgi:hypothetical protein